MSPMLQLLILAGIALFLIFKLRGILGTRTGFEQRPPTHPSVTIDQSSKVVPEDEAQVDEEIARLVAPNSENAQTLGEMKAYERNFSVQEFLDGAGKAYEWILTSFGEGKVDDLKPFLSTEVFNSFKQGVDQRDPDNLVKVQFVRTSGKDIKDVKFEQATGRGEITIEFASELISYVEDPEGNVVEGDKSNPVRQNDEWTFSRIMGENDPNWILVATG